jgi:hypothetical protein
MKIAPTTMRPIRILVRLAGLPTHLTARSTSTIWLQWASRLGKTFFGQPATLKNGVDSEPCPLMFASVDRKLAVDVIGRTYRMLELCPSLRDELRPPSRRKQDLVSLAFCRPTSPGREASVRSLIRPSALAMLMNR